MDGKNDDGTPEPSGCEHVEAVLPLNDGSVLRSSDPADNEKERRLLEEWNKWEQHRGSSRLATTTTPNDPEEDFENSERFVSGLFSNASQQNPSAMTSLMVRQPAPPPPPPQHQQQQNATSSSTGFNMKQYEEELVKLRNDNFSLKLRIHLLEERQGLEARPGDGGQENVFRVNLDLRVEKETLKQRMEEKDRLLRDAYLALEDMEREKSRMEADLRAKPSPGGDLVLEEAFGTMNLGKDGAEELESLRAKVEQLEAKEAEEEERMNGEVADLKGELAVSKKAADDLEVRLGRARRDLEASEESRVKSQMSASGLTQMNLEQAARIESLEAGVEKRDKAIRILTDEYEKAKVKVRRYRSEAAGGGGDADVLKEELRLSRKEVELLKGELGLCRNAFMRSGAAKAVQMMEGVYKIQVDKVERHNARVVALMRKRLEEISDCLRRLLSLRRMSSSSFDLDASLAEVSSLTEALDESCRSILDNPEETQIPEGVMEFPAEEILREFEGGDGDDSAADLSPATAKLAAENRLKEYERLMSELRDSSKRAADAEGRTARMKRDLAEATRERDEAKWEAEGSAKKAAELEAAAEEARREAGELRAATGNAEELRKQLAAANEKLERYRERQQKVDRALRDQLAKTHVVLKMTKGGKNDAVHE